MLAGSLTPPDKVNGEGAAGAGANSHHHPPPHPHHAIMPVMPTLHTPPSPLPTPSPPVYERFTYFKDQR
ncbi:hypothetical protein Avbf_01799 [Armadillidium vulgare]|nr:hypothetical protein Avbf_01799 [Armadillidium vulgare]